MKYALDACALIALLDEETGSKCIQELLEQAENGSVEVFMHIINLFEVCCHRRYKNDIDDTAEFLNMIYESPIKIINLSCDDIFQKALFYKTEYSVSLADSFALAAAQTLNATLVTCDHHELDVVCQAGRIPFLWLR